VPPGSYALAAVLSAGELERLYSGLSMLVSAASDGERAAALAGFAALDLLLDPDLARRQLEQAERAQELARSNGKVRL